MRWVGSTLVANRFFIIRDFSDEVQVDIIEGQLVPDKKLTFEEEKYFKIQWNEQEAKSRVITDSISSSGNHLVLSKLSDI